MAVFTLAVFTEEAEITELISHHGAAEHTEKPMVSSMSSVSVW
jgi:hypothetical protein